jgi:hypothetical protein
MPKKAGRVAFVLKGDYSNDTSYTKLDLVSYNGKSYACKQPATGILPTNTTYWQLMSDPDGGIEVTTMPTASAELVGHVRIYIGQTTATYTSGQSYQCIEDPENAGVYIWEPTASKVTVDNVTIQENASGQLETVVKIWNGSSADWKVLSLAEKSKWNIVNITDDADDTSTIETQIQALTNSVNTNTGNIADNANDIQTLTNTVNTNSDNIADNNDEYDSNHNYAVGEYCISPDDGTLQKCAVATSGGSWATVKDTCFTKDSLANAVKALNSDLSEKLDKSTSLLTGFKSSGDCNLFESWSAYHCSSNVSNVPLSGSWAMIFTIWTFGPYNKMQIGITVGSTKKMYFRFYDLASWTSWIAT